MHGDILCSILNIVTCQREFREGDGISTFPYSLLDMGAVLSKIFIKISKCTVYLGNSQFCGQYPFGVLVIGVEKIEGKRE
jgi:hypothetical protein